MGLGPILWRRLGRERWALEAAGRLGTPGWALPRLQPTRLASAVNARLDRASCCCSFLTNEEQKQQHVHGDVEDGGSRTWRRRGRRKTGPGRSSMWMPRESESDGRRLDLNKRTATAGKIQRRYREEKR